MKTTLTLDMSGSDVKCTSDSPQKPRQNKRACQAKAKLSTQAAPGAPASWKPRQCWKTKPRTPKTNALRLTTTYLLAAPCDFIRPENRVSYLHWERPSDSESLRANHSAHPVTTPATIRQVPHQLLIEATLSRRLFLKWKCLQMSTYLVQNQNHQQRES